VIRRSASRDGLISGVPARLHLLTAEHGQFHVFTYSIYEIDIVTCSGLIDTGEGRL